MLKIKFLLFFSVILSVNTYSQTDGWKTFESDLCTIKYPSNWYEKELTEEYTSLGMKFMLMSSSDNPKDKFFENCNLATEQKKAPITLQQYLSSLGSILGSIIDKYKMKSSSTKTNSSGEYACLEYTGTMNGNKLTWIQCIWIKGIDIYVLSFTSSTSAFKKYKPIFLSIADSFVIKDQY